MHPMLSRLESDHQRMLKMLYTLNAEVSKFYGLHRGKADVDTILSVLDYIQVYPEKWHHPIEDILFAHLAQHPQADQYAIAEVQRDHQRLEALSDRLVQIFGELRLAQSNAGLSIIRLCKHYYTRQISHIHDERHLFLDAEKMLTADQWQRIEDEIEHYLDQEAIDERDAYLALLRQPQSASSTATTVHESRK